MKVYGSAYKYFLSYGETLQKVLARPFHRWLTYRFLPFISPARAFLYKPLTSRDSQTFSGASTKISMNTRPSFSCRVRAISRSCNTYALTKRNHKIRLQCFPHSFIIPILRYQNDYTRSENNEECRTEKGSSRDKASITTEAARHGIQRIRSYFRGVLSLVVDLHPRNVYYGCKNYKSSLRAAVKLKHCPHQTVFTPIKL